MGNKTAVVIVGVLFVIIIVLVIVLLQPMFLTDESYEETESY